MKRIIPATALIAFSMASFAGALTEEEKNISKCVGFLASQKHIAPKLMDASTDIASTKMKAIAAKNKYPSVTLSAMTNVSSNSAGIIVNYLVAAVKADDKEKINSVYRRGVDTCKKSGLTIKQEGEKITVSIDDINEAL